MSKKTESNVMTLNFDIGHGVTMATVENVPNEDFFFAKNGEPGQIFCHCNQGGSLTVSSRGLIGLNRNDAVYPPSPNERIVLIRESSDPSSRGYTKALRWALEADWQEVAWVVNAQKVYRAIAYNHRNKGHPMSNLRTDVKLVEGTLMEIIKQFPRGAVAGDPLQEKYSTRVGDMTLSYSVRWERLDPDGKQPECGDPRPIHFTV